MHLPVSFFSVVAEVQNHSVPIMTRLMTRATTTPSQVAENRDADNNVAANNNANDSVINHNLAANNADDTVTIAANNNEEIITSQKMSPILTLHAIISIS